MPKYIAYGGPDLSKHDFDATDDRTAILKARELSGGDPLAIAEVFPDGTSRTIGWEFFVDRVEQRQQRRRDPHPEYDPILLERTVVLLIARVIIVVAVVLLAIWLYR